VAWRGRIVGVGAATAAVLLLAIGSPAAGGTREPFTPGAAGAGDPYYPLDGNGGYDVRHYRLDLRYDPATDVLDGVATVEARATQNLSRFNLDLEGLTVRSAEVDGRPAAWTREGGELIVTPARGLRDGRRFTTTISYGGVPETLDEFGASGFFHTDDGAVIAGQPHVADTWFPVNDHPTDRAAYTFRIAVPAGLEAVANGVLEQQRTRGGWTTWTWDAEEPMASYLATVCVGEFDLRSYRRDGIRFVDAVDPDLSASPLGPAVDAAFAGQDEMLDFVSELFGRYPFSAAGGIVDDLPELEFSLENQTRPIYQVGIFTDPLETQLTFVHEIAHQWVGDSLTIAQWRHLWLNEGFATYVEWLWMDREGIATAQELFDLFYGLFPPDDAFWSTVVGDPGPDHLFDFAVYARGAMTLHQLRLAVGDRDFFRILHRWTSRNAGETVTTDEFVELAERISGTDLDDLFETWLFTPGRPELPTAAAGTGTARAGVAAAHRRARR
jgi:aminopeptidase N